MSSSKPESFTYLENQRKLNLDSILFKPYVFPSANDGRWMLMEMADLDQDDDQDILLGSSTVLPLQTGHEFGVNWRKKNLNFLLVRNEH